MNKMKKLLEKFGYDVGVRKNKFSTTLFIEQGDAIVEFDFINEAMEICTVSSDHSVARFKGDLD